MLWCLWKTRTEPLNSETCQPVGDSPVPPRRSGPEGLPHQGWKYLLERVSVQRLTQISYLTSIKIGSPKSFRKIQCSPAAGKRDLQTSRQHIPSALQMSVCPCGSQKPTWAFPALGITSLGCCGRQSRTAPTHPPVPILVTGTNIFYFSDQKSKCNFWLLIILIIK